ncbi:MAG: type 4a pilus biogenesis protein PilO [Candidatus Marinimicrobia bacterium]|nr:type 4a pilus biogenesis protein PilO [Candidatus Neomarinimicrobiota bacterium]
MNNVQRKLIGLIGALLTIIAGWYFFIHFPISAELEPIEARIEFIENQMVKVEEMKGGISELIDDLEDARDAVMLLKYKMGSTLTVDSILMKIRVQALKHELQVQTLAPKLSLNSFNDEEQYKKESVKGLVKLPLELRLRGEYLNFAKFMDSLSEERISYSVEDLRIRRKVDELPVLSFQVVMYLYLIMNESELSKT